MERRKSIEILVEASREDTTRKTWTQTCGYYCNGFDRRIARQQLCKHGPTCKNGGGCVFYAVMSPTIGKLCFLCGPCCAYITRIPE
jgi:hypothetical protein